MIVAAGGHGARPRRAVPDAGIDGAAAARGGGAGDAGSPAAPGEAAKASDDAGSLADGPVAVATEGPQGGRAKSGRLDAGVTRPRPSLDAGSGVTGISAGPPADAALPPTIAPAPAVGRIDLDLRPWCDLRIDGIDFGRVQGKRTVEVRPGRHSLECRQGARGRVVHTELEVVAGVTQAWTQSLVALVEVKVDVSAALIRLDGVRYRRGDVATVAAGRHRVEILVDEVVTETAFVDIAVACSLRDRPTVVCDE
jgi:hypothetical protein